MNDVVSLNWKKIRKVLPKARRYTLDRIPTFEEIKDIYEAADIRGKALTILFISSGVRERAIEDLKIKDYSPIQVDGKFVAGWYSQQQPSISILIKRDIWFGGVATIIYPTGEYFVTVKDDDGNSVKQKFTVLN